MKKKIILLGCTGKMGLALMAQCPDDFEIIGLSSQHFDARHPDSVRGIIEKECPYAIINTVGYLGIEPCEKNPLEAFAVNSIFPYELAKMANECHSILVHFSTDAVFDGKGSSPYYSESDTPAPINVYGATKLSGDCLVQGEAEKYYIPRISVLFGESNKNSQFVEKMLSKIKSGAREIKISNDIFCTPCFSKDVADGVFDLLQKNAEFGVYHLANEGKTSLYGLMLEVARLVDPDVKVVPASYLDFPSIGKKNLCTPLVSNKGVALRPWQQGVKEYIENYYGNH